MTSHIRNFPPRAMFDAGDIVSVLIPNEANGGFDYRADAPVKVGGFVSVSVQKKIYDGMVIGAGGGAVPAEKIKPILARHESGLPEATIRWIRKMSEWTMMPMGAVLKLMMSAADFKPSVRKSKVGAAEYFDTGRVVLNDEQRAAAAQIGLGGFGVHLLDGITGSGKTQVYFDAVLRAHRSGRAVLLMMPEIALTAQFITRFEDRFGGRPAVWHSGLSPAKRRAIWRGVLSGDVKIVVGTRSALFLPWQNLGLIVVDEEHDSSYKQEEMGIYHARDMAVLMGSLADFPVILASATPSFETIRNVMAGKYKVSKLTSRFGGAMLPSVEIVDMRRKKL